MSALPPFLAAPYLEDTAAEKIAQNEFIARFYTSEGADSPVTQPGDLGMPLEQLARRYGDRVWAFAGVAILFAMGLAGWLTS